MNSVEVLIRNATRGIEDQIENYEEWVARAREFNYEEALKFVAQNYTPLDQRRIFEASDEIRGRFAQLIVTGQLKNLVDTSDIGIYEMDGEFPEEGVSAKTILEEILYEATYQHIEEQKPYGSRVTSSARLNPVCGIMGRSRRGK